MIQAPAKSRSVHTQKRGPFVERMTFPVELQPNGICSLLSILFTRKPLTIFLGIISIDINSINSVVVRGRKSHIIKEVLENFPTRVKFDPPSPIVRIISIFLSKTPIFHPMPNTIDSLLGQTMFGSILGALLSSSTPTTRGMAPNEVPKKDNGFFATVAAAKPFCGICGDTVYCDQPPESFISKITCFHGDNILKNSAKVKYYLIGGKSNGNME